MVFLSLIVFFIKRNISQVFQNEEGILAIVFNECLGNLMVDINHPTVLSLFDGADSTF